MSCGAHYGEPLHEFIFTQYSSNVIKFLKNKFIKLEDQEMSVACLPLIALYLEPWIKLHNMQMKKK
jgi:hypothetical protein